MSRKLKQVYEIPMRVERGPTKRGKVTSARNVHGFFARIEGYPDEDLPQGCVRSANGIRWRVA